MFKVINVKNGLPYIVYSVRDTTATSAGYVEFLVFYCGEWGWLNADNFYESMELNGLKPEVPTITHEGLNG